MSFIIHFYTFGSLISDLDHATLRTRHLAIGAQLLLKISILQLILSFYLKLFIWLFLLVTDGSNNLSLLQTCKISIIRMEAFEITFLKWPCTLDDLKTRKKTGNGDKIETH